MQSQSIEPFTSIISKKKKKKSHKHQAENYKKLEKLGESHGNSYVIMTLTRSEGEEAMALSLLRTTTTRSSGKASKRSEIPAPVLVEVLRLLLHTIPECNRVFFVVAFTLKKKPP